MNKIDWSKPVQTRDGRKVEIWKTDAYDTKYPVLGVVYENSTECFPESWTYSGRWYNGRDDKYPGDLVNVPEEVVGHLVVVYHKLRNRLESRLFVSKEYAESYINNIKNTGGVCCR